jgi:predicted enzyme related to lactoylglutathione lyase
VILEAGRATLELADPPHAAYIDEVEVGRRVAGHIRVAFEVDDSRSATRALSEAGATVIAEPTRTPWNSLNARLEAPGGLQLTLFTEIGAPNE